MLYPKKKARGKLIYDIIKGALTDMRITFSGTSHGFSEKNRFNPVTLAEVGGKLFVIDAGGPADYFVVNSDKRIEDIKGVFITHMHSDHVNSLPQLLISFLGFHYNKDALVFMPDQDGIDGLKAWMKAMYEDDSRIASTLNFRVIAGGVIYKDEDLLVEAVPTRHLDAIGRPCYAFRFETGGKNVLFTGDLAPEYEDLEDVCGAYRYSLVVCDGSHGSLKKNFDKIAGINTERLIFTHVYEPCFEGYEELLPKLPFDASRAEDGECVTIV